MGYVTLSGKMHVDKHATRRLTLQDQVASERSELATYDTKIFNYQGLRPYYLPAQLGTLEDIGVNGEIVL